MEFFLHKDSVSSSGEYFIDFGGCTNNFDTSSNDFGMIYSPCVEYLSDLNDLTKIQEKHKICSMRKLKFLRQRISGCYICHETKVLGQVERPKNVSNRSGNFPGESKQEKLESKKKLINSKKVEGFSQISPPEKCKTSEMIIKTFMRSYMR